MPRLLQRGKWYDALSPRALYEIEFEAILTHHAAFLFPDFHLIPFKHPVFTETDSAIPDLALIHRDYREWWVVEVEMEYHSLRTHVLPQVKTLAHAKYGESERDCLCNASPALEPGPIAQMMKGSQPRVLVIGNRLTKDWEVHLSQYDARMLGVAIYRSDQNEYILHVDGFIPSGSSINVSLCRHDPILPRFLLVDSPNSLGTPTNAVFTIDFEGSPTNWSRVETSDRVWLAPRGKVTLDPRATYQMTRRSDGSLALERQEK